MELNFGMLGTIVDFLFRLEPNRILLILTFLTVVFAARQLRWTRLETAVPEWKIVDVTKHSHRNKDHEEYTVNATIKNVGKGRAHNVEDELFQSDVKLRELDKEDSKEDVIRDKRDSIGYRTIVNPGDVIKPNFRIKQLDKLNYVLIRLEPEDTVHGSVWLEKEQIDEEYTNWLYRLERLPVKIYRKIKHELRSQEIETI